MSPARHLAELGAALAVLAGTVALVAAAVLALCLLLYR